MCVVIQSPPCELGRQHNDVWLMEFGDGWWWEMISRSQELRCAGIKAYIWNGKRHTWRERQTSSLCRGHGRGCLCTPCHHPCSHCSRHRSNVEPPVVVSFFFHEAKRLTDDTTTTSSAAALCAHELCKQPCGDTLVRPVAWQHNRTAFSDCFLQRERERLRLVEVLFV